MSEALGNQQRERFNYDIRSYDEVSHSIDALDFYEEKGSDIAVAHVNGEIAGYLVYESDDTFTELDLIEVLPFWQGIDIDGRKPAKDLIQHVADTSPSETGLITYCNAGNGKIQYMAEQQGLETRGLKIESNMDDGITPIMTKPGENSFSEVEAFLSPSVRTAAEAASDEDILLDYQTNEQTQGYDIDYQNISQHGSNAVKANLNEGSRPLNSVLSELRDLEEVRPSSWAYTVDFEIHDPAAFSITDELAGQNWSLVNIERDGRATMFKPVRESEPFRATPRTQEFLDDVGLPYRIDEQGERSDTISVIPAKDQDVSYKQPITAD